MKSFTRFTAGFLLFIGALLILIGLVIILAAFFGNSPSHVSNPDVLSLNLRVLTGFINFIVGGAIGFQGIFILVIGQALWLLIDISDKTEQTNRHLLAIFRQIYKPAS
jgi:hypothetical protein